MAIQPVTCPQCQTALRTKRALTPTDMVRCPQCGNHFLGTAALSPSLVRNIAPVLPPTPPVSNNNRAFMLLLIPAAIVALFLGAGAVLGTYLFLRTPATQTVVDDKKERELAEKQKQLEDQEKELAAQRAKLTENERRHQFQTFMDDGKKSLSEKNYVAAETSYTSALELYPNDPDANKGLAAAKAGKISLTINTSSSEEQKKRKATFDKFVEQGQQAMTAKKYADAVIYFESALGLMSTEEAALQGLADAKKELDKDKVEKEKLAAYQKFIAAGTAAMDAGRYTDAIREYLGAQGVIPGDAVAVKGQRDAEQKLADAKNGDDFNKLVANARQALRDKKYDEAIGGVQAALRLMPNDAGAKQLLDDAKKAQTTAKGEYDRLLAAANTALVAKRYEEAQRLYAKALDLSPGDPVVLKAQQDLQNLMGDLQAGQVAFNRFMANGIQAMNANRYADAVAAFTEALRIIPTDPDAQKGLTDAQAQLTILVNRKANYDRFMLAGAAALNKKFYNDAVAAYRDALVAAPDDPLAIAGLHQAKYLRGMSDGDKALLLKKFGEAIHSYEEALKEMPGDKIAKEQLSSARYQRGMTDGTAALVAKKFADAVPLFEEALKEKPKDVNASLQLHEAKYGRAMADGDAAMRAQKYDDAITAYQAALNERPQDGKATKALMLAQKMKK